MYVEIVGPAGDVRGGLLGVDRPDEGVLLRLEVPEGAVLHVLRQRELRPEKAPGTEDRRDVHAGRPHEKLEHADVAQTTDAGYLKEDEYSGGLRYVSNDPLGEALSLLERAWAIIANASSGNWSLEPGTWQEAARTWRDSWLYYLGFKTRATSPVPGEAIPCRSEKEAKNFSDLMESLRGWKFTKAQANALVDRISDRMEKQDPMTATEAEIRIGQRQDYITYILRILRKEDFYLTRAEFTLIADASADAFARSKR